MFAKEPASHVTSGPVVTPTLSVAVRVTATVAPEATSSRVAGLKVIIGGSVSLVTEIVIVALSSFPAASEAVAVHVASVSALTTGAVYMLFAKEPASHVTSGPVVTPTLSVAVRVTETVAPESTARVAGLKVTTGAVVSAATEIVIAALPSFPAASVAVAVHVTSVSALTTGAVYMLFAKEPIVHVTVGVIVPSTSSVAVRVTETVAPEFTVNVAGLKLNSGATVSLATEIVSVAVPAFPAASVAVAVHVAMVSTLTSGAV